MPSAYALPLAVMLYTALLLPPPVALHPAVPATHTLPNTARKTVILLFKTTPPLVSKVTIIDANRSKRKQKQSKRYKGSYRFLCFPLGILQASPLTNCVGNGLPPCLIPAGDGHCYINASCFETALEFSGGLRKQHPLGVFPWQKSKSLHFRPFSQSGRTCRMKRNLIMSSLIGANYEYLCYFFFFFEITTPAIMAAATTTTTTTTMTMVIVESEESVVLDPLPVVALAPSAWVAAVV